MINVWNEQFLKPVSYDLQQWLRYGYIIGPIRTMRVNGFTTI